MTICPACGHVFGRRTREKRRRDIDAAVLAAYGPNESKASIARATRLSPSVVLKSIKRLGLNPIDGRRERRHNVDSLVRAAHRTDATIASLARQTELYPSTVRASLIRQRLEVINGRTLRRNFVRHAQVVAVYQECARNASETSRRLGISRERVRQILHKNGIVPRTSREAKAEQLAKTDSAVRAFHAEKLTNAEIAERVGVSKNYVSVSLRRLGLKPHKPPARRSEQREKAKRLFDAGASLSEIRDGAGYKSETTTRIILWRCGRRFRDRQVSSAPETPA